MSWTKAFVTMWYYVIFIHQNEANNYKYIMKTSFALFYYSKYQCGPMLVPFPTTVHKHRVYMVPVLYLTTAVNIPVWPHAGSLYHDGPQTSCLYGSRLIPYYSSEHTSVVPCWFPVPRRSTNIVSIWFPSSVSSLARWPPCWKPLEHNHKQCDQ